MDPNPSFGSLEYVHLYIYIIIYLMRHPYLCSLVRRLGRVSPDHSSGDCRQTLFLVRSPFSVRTRRDYIHIILLLRILYNIGADTLSYIRSRADDAGTVGSRLRIFSEGWGWSPGI